MKFLIFNTVVAGALGWMLFGAPMMNPATEPSTSAPTFTEKARAPEATRQVVKEVPATLTAKEQAALDLTPVTVPAPGPAPTAASVETAAVSEEASLPRAPVDAEFSEPLSPRTPKAIFSPPSERFEYEEERAEGLQEEGSSTVWTIDEQEEGEPGPDYMTASERRVALHNIARDMEQLFLKSAE